MIRFRISAIGVPLQFVRRHRMHSTIRDVTPMEFVPNHQDRFQAARETTPSALV